jgi:hypothetical protein
MRVIHPQKELPSGWIPPWERPRSSRCSRDSPVADYYLPVINTLCHSLYCPAIAVSPCICMPPISNFTRSHWCSGQPGPHIRMGAFCLNIHWDCNVMGDVAKISFHIPFTCAPNAILSLPNDIYQSKSTGLSGYWHSIACSFRLLAY